VNTTLNGITYGGGSFVAVGEDQTILSSSNAISWTVRSRTPGVSRAFRGAAYGNGRFVAVGNRDAFVYSSTDGVNWRSAVSNVQDRELNGVIYANGLFAAVGYDATVPCSYILTSSTGHAWSAHLLKPLAQRLIAVAYGNGRFAAVGSGGTIVVSTNGSDWTARPSGVSSYLFSVTFNGSKFVAGSEGGTTLSSADGLTWTTAAPASFTVRGLASGNGAVVAVGDYAGSGRIHPSPDGITWPANSLTCPQTVRAIAYGPKYFVGVGDGGIIVQSSVPQVTVKTLAEEIEISLSGEPGGYQLETSTDLRNWSPLAGYDFQWSPTNNWVLRRARNSGTHEFYRAVFLP
jgi:hypothetical protein